MKSKYQKYCKSAPFLPAASSSTVRAEAASLKPLLKNENADAVRDLIAVSETDIAALRGRFDTRTVTMVLDYRQRVLEQFNLLTARRET